MSTRFHMLRFHLITHVLLTLIFWRIFWCLRFPQLASPVATSAALLDLRLLCRPSYHQIARNPHPSRQVRLDFLVYRPTRRIHRLICLV